MTGIACGMRAAFAAEDWRRITLGLIVEDINGNDIGVGYRRFTQPQLGDSGSMNYSQVKGLEISFLGCNINNPHVGLNILTHVPKDYFGALAIQLANGKWVAYQTSVALWQNTALVNGTQVTSWQWFNVPGSVNGVANGEAIWLGASTDPVGSIRGYKILG